MGRILHARNETGLGRQPAGRLRRPLRYLLGWGIRRGLRSLRRYLLGWGLWCGLGGALWRRGVLSRLIPRVDRPGRRNLPDDLVDDLVGANASNPLIGLEQQPVGQTGNRHRLYVIWQHV